MSTRPAEVAQGAEGSEGAVQGAGRLLFDISGIDLNGCVADREQIAKYNPHRGAMALLDRVVWTNAELTRAVGVRRVSMDEFWVPGHFPAKPMLPGVLMIETAAQLACYLFLVRRPGGSIVAFLRIESAAFRSSVSPGDDFYVMVLEVRAQKRRFISDVQGFVKDRVAFDARISGMLIEPG